MSVTVSTAGISFLGLKSLHNLTNRLSGTSTLETLGSIVPVDYFFVCSDLRRTWTLRFHKNTVLTERKILCRYALLAKQIEERTLADVGQTNDTNRHIVLGSTQECYIWIFTSPFLFSHFFYFFIWCVCRSRSQLQKSKRNFNFWPVSSRVKIIFLISYIFLCWDYSLS